jgi:hypothetical protein
VPVEGPAAATTASGRSHGPVFLLVMTGLAAAIACFGFASLPATYVPGRATADFMIRHRLDVTVLGIGLIVAAAFAVLWSNKV